MISEVLLNFFLIRMVTFGMDFALIFFTGERPLATRGAHQALETALRRPLAGLERSKPRLTLARPSTAQTVGAPQVRSLLYFIFSSCT